MLDSTVKDNTSAMTSSFVDISTEYLFFEFISIFDSVILFLMALSLLKYTFFWIPSLNLLTVALQHYFSSTIKRILVYVLALCLGFSAFTHYMYN